MSDMKIKLTLAADDNASRALIKAIEAIKKADANAGKSTGTAAQAAARAQAEAAKAAKLRTTAAQAAGTLGIRTERQIQAEILRTQRAYQKLQASGRASQNDLQRGAQATRQRMRELNQELGRVSASQRALNMGRGGIALGAAITAGTRIASIPVKKEMTYDTKLRNMTNISHGGGKVSKEDWDAGMQETDAQISNITRSVSGSSRDKTIDTVNTAIAEGFDIQGAYKIAPTILKGAIGGDAEAKDVMLLARAGMDFMKPKGGKSNPDDASWIVDMAMRSGQLGAYEMSDMAANFPKFLTQAEGSYSGKNDMAGLFAMIQTLRKSSGSVESANTQYSQFQNDMNSKQTRKAFKERGIDLTEQMIKNSREKGIAPHETFMQYLTSAVDNDPVVKKAIAKTNKDPSKRTENELKSIEVAKKAAMMPFLRNSYSRDAAMGFMKNSDFYHDQKIDLLSSYDGTTDVAHARMSEGSEAKTQDLKNEWTDAEHGIMKEFTNSLGDTAKAISDYAAEYPGLTKSIVGASFALIGLAGIAGSAALANVLIGGGRRVPIPAGGRLPAPAGGGGGPPLPNGSSNLWNRITRNLGPLIGAGVAGYQIYGNQNRTGIDQKTKNVEHGKSVGWLAGATGGWELGAAMGNGSGNPYVKVGSAVLGSVLGGLGGTELGGSVVAAAQERYDEFMNPERSVKGRKNAADKYNAAKALYESTLTPDQLQKYRKDKAEAEAYEKEQLSMGVPVIPFNDPVVTDPKWMQQANGRDQKRIDYENNRRAFWPTYENASQSQIAQASATAERLRTLQSPAIGGMPEMAQQSTQTINEMVVKINEMLSQVIAKEVVVNMVGMMDGKEMFRGVEKVMITELNRGG